MTADVSVFCTMCVFNTGICNMNILLLLCENGDCIVHIEVIRPTQDGLSTSWLDSSKNLSVPQAGITLPAIA